MDRCTSIVRVLIVCCIMLAACQRSNSDSIVIGLSMNDLKDPFLLKLKAAAETAAAEAGATLLVTSSEANLAKQINAVEDLLQRGIDVLGVNPVDAKGIVPVIKAANAAGIPVITVDTDAYGGTVETFVGSDNVKGGELAAQYLIDQLQGAGTVAVLDDVPGKAAIMDRIAGFQSVIGTAPGIQIVTVQPAFGRRDVAITVTENILQAHPDIDAVFATADAMALGAMGVIQSLQRTKPVILVGFDACEEAVQAIQQGTLQADIAQFPDQIGRGFVEYAMKVIRKEPVPQKVPIPVTLVTAENVADFAVK